MTKAVRSSPTSHCPFVEYQQLVAWGLSSSSNQGHRFAPRRILGRSLVAFCAMCMPWLASPSVTMAQDTDILIDLDGTQLSVNASVHPADIRASFGGDGTVLEVSNPGYATARFGTLTPGDTVRFDVLGPLLYSVGSGWNPPTHDAYLRQFRPAVPDHSVVVTGETKDQPGFPIQQADDNGAIHSHLRFELGTLSGEPPMVGAYAIQQVLSSTLHESSNPFLLVFNNGLETNNFIQAVIDARAFWEQDTFVDCNGDQNMDAGDLTCVTTASERDLVLAEIESVPGDLDGDGSVNFADFLTLSRNFGTNRTSYSDGNIDLIGPVDFADFLVLSRNFGFAHSELVASVPEPTGDCMLFLATLIVFRHERFRRPISNRTEGQLVCHPPQLCTSLIIPVSRPASLDTMIVERTTFMRLIRSPAWRPQYGVE